MHYFCYRVTCVYLACKVEEFNISIQQFVANIKGDREKASDIILNDELLLMQQLNFHLTVHNPYRPVTGLLIDIKVCTQTRSARVFHRMLLMPPIASTDNIIVHLDWIDRAQDRDQLKALVNMALNLRVP
jgi:cyclin ccl1